MVVAANAAQHVEELAHRDADGIEVSLLWSPPTTASPSAASTRGQKSGSPLPPSRASHSTCSTTPTRTRRASTSATRCRDQPWRGSGRVAPSVPSAIPYGWIRAGPKPRVFGGVRPRRRAVASVCGLRRRALPAGPRPAAAGSPARKAGEGDGRPSPRGNARELPGLHDRPRRRGVLLPVQRTIRGGCRGGEHPRRSAVRPHRRGNSHCLRRTARNRTHNRSKNGTTHGIDVVGREEELGVDRGLPRWIEEGPSALVLSGEPGIGKTILWEAGVDEAAALTASSSAAASRPRPRSRSRGCRICSHRCSTRWPLAGAAATTGARGRAAARGAWRAAPDPHAIGLALLDVLRLLAERGPC